MRFLGLGLLLPFSPLLKIRIATPAALVRSPAFYFVPFSLLNPVFACRLAAVELDSDPVSFAE